MLASEKPEVVTREEILELLEGLMRNVEKTDAWSDWVDFFAWTDGQVYRCLEVCYEKVARSRTGAYNNR